MYGQLQFQFFSALGFVVGGDVILYNPVQCKVFVFLSYRPLRVHITRPLTVLLQKLYMVFSYPKRLIKNKHILCIHVIYSKIQNLF